MEKLKYEINEEVTFKSDDVLTFLRQWYMDVLKHYDSEITQDSRY